MRLTTKSEYALLATIDLAVAIGDGPVNARTISLRREVPLKFLEQILHGLRQADVITSVRGAHGGFVLAKDPEKLTVLDVVEAVEGPLQATVCDSANQATGVGCTKQANCAAAHVWTKATKVLRDEFQSTTIASLAGAQKRFDKEMKKEMQ